MKGSGAKRSVCPGSCMSTGAKLPVAPVESAPMYNKIAKNSSLLSGDLSGIYLCTVRIVWSLGNLALVNFGNNNNCNKVSP